ncbi:virulence factor [Paenibacillus chitinolyticus]|uniref:Virulence factor n=1 Tax=Paenibacillus chitinolyticus TaxID=79263 RepID=A0A410X3Z7_9BACL|nr:conserved virulence factor C family protein [Paenibacillus chitinolyticus]MCY9592195.1 conserved virulence factor C family protein [Paenibacillus chitinolyticus]MCY9598430.1 conserved virulence factor C family protein [Paenibacillus chitinolyticus]QAV21363.1 virulence factor [Paenibacillus chitinolyticus]
MNLVSIEPTPSPNTMKLNLDKALPKGRSLTFTRKQRDNAPGYIQQLLDIPGVTSVFQVADFIALDRSPKGDWKQILTQARELLGSGGSQASLPSEDEAGSGFGGVKVLLQTFRGIPMQIRVNAGGEEARAALPERFTQAAMKATENSPHLLKERKLQELDVRYGELQDVLNEVVQEVDASYDDNRLNLLTEQAAKGLSEADYTEAQRPAELTEEEIGRLLDDPDWKKRYAALQSVKATPQTLPLLAKALGDEKTSVRRLATVYLGDIKEPEVLPYLFQALEDRTPAVRRTAGDTLSDLGDPAAVPAMSKALKDSNKLVRWRAARFLYEVGDDSCLEALREAVDDPEFEISMQVQMAIARIEGGHAAEGSVWQQMTRSRQGTDAPKQD